MLKTCERCGNEFEGRWNQKYCKDCRVEAYRESRNLRRRRARQKKHSKESHLIEHVKAAKAAGMSYGKYMAMLKQKEYEGEKQ